MSDRFVDVIVIAIDQSDADAWLEENRELADAVTVVPVHDRGWDGAAPSRLGFAAHTYVLTRRASGAGSIGGTKAPRWIRLAALMAERRRPVYLATGV